MQKLVGLVGYAQPSRSDTNILSQFVVSSGAGVRGIRNIKVTGGEVLKMRGLRGVVVDADSAASRSYGLLTGEVYQFVARRILASLTVDMQEVNEVISPERVRRPGKRVDDWSIVTADGRKTLAEVKASRRLAYFEKAFRQLKTMKDYGSRGLFLGFCLLGKPGEPKNVLVMLVEKPDTLAEFRQSIREMLTK